MDNADYETPIDYGECVGRSFVNNGKQPEGYGAVTVCRVRRSPRDFVEFYIGSLHFTSGLTQETYSGAFR